MRKAIFIAALWGAVLAAPAQEFTLQIGSVTWIGSAGGYNPFGNASYPNTVNFTVTKQMVGNRRFAVGAGRSTSSGTYSRRLAFGGNFLNYQLYVSTDLAQVLRAPLDATPAEVISGSSKDKPGAIVPLSFIFFIPPNQLAAPGTYTDRITFGVYHAFNDPGAPEDSKTINFSAVVVASAALCLVPTGSGFNQASTSQTMDFGTLSQGQSRTCDLLVRKNTSCTVTFVSGNRGVLKTSPQSTGDQIPYTLRLNGAPVDLSTTASISLPPGVSPTQDGSRFPLVVTIGDPGTNPSAGDYRDEVMITVTVQ